MSGVPSVITVFSAPNYCGSYNNKGAVLMLNNNAIKLKTFSDEQRHFCLGPGQDLFSLSIPIIKSNVSEMFLNLINQCTRYDLNTMEEVDVK
jgi:serine/threonine-protein phosphatase 2B catalytic subunit